MNKKTSILLLAFIAIGIFIFQSCTREENSVDLKTENRSDLPVLGNINIESPNNACLEYLDVNPDCPWQDSTVTFTHPDYPGCNFWVNYSYRNCPGQYAEFVYRSLGAAGDCDIFDNDVAINGYNIEKIVADFALNKILWEYGIANAKTCDPRPIIAKVYRANCTTSFTDPIRQVSYGDFPCGVSCCKSTISFCKDPITGEVTAKEVSKGQLYDCISDSFKYPKGAIIVVPCTANCFDFFPTKM